MDDERLRDFTADAAGGADDQGGPIVCHVVLLRADAWEEDGAPADKRKLSYFV
jgi:hypothetical protein